MSYLPAAVLGSHLATGAKGQGSKGSCWKRDTCSGALGWLTPFSLPSVCDGLPRRPQSLWDKAQRTNLTGLTRYPASTPKTLHT